MLQKVLIDLPLKGAILFPKYVGLLEGKEVFPHQGHSGKDEQELQVRFKQEFRFSDIEQSLV